MIVCTMLQEGTGDSIVVDIPDRSGRRRHGTEEKKTTTRRRGREEEGKEEELSPE